MRHYVRFSQIESHMYMYIQGCGIGPADLASAGPKFENYNPQSQFMSLKCILIGTC